MIDRTGLTMTGSGDPKGEAIVKICGITNPEDALQAVRSGANAIGINFYPKSPRFVSFETAEAILSRVPDTVLRVAVCVSPSEALAEKCDSLGFDVLQIHGVRSPDQLPASPLRIWVAVSPQQAASFPEREILIDISWGRGLTADWEEVEKLKRPLILSGGLHEGNVREAVERLRPTGVDVCSGVEQAPGRKDAGKIARFIQEVQRGLTSLQRGKVGSK